ncbi:MAG: hypothetical protein GWN77_00765, partial [Gammaproteobacteria bacterium]|nr:hypothetical protein [Gammaproteobacteria bacterium]
AASLCIAHMIADAAYKDVLPPPIDFPSDSFYACDKGALYPFLDRVYAGWRSMPRWAEYSTYISVIPQEIKLKRDWKENWDLIRRWDLPTSDDDLLRMWQDNVNSRRVKDTG